MYPYRLSSMIVDKLGKEFLYKFQPYKITKEEISADQYDIVFVIRPTMKDDLDHINDLKGECCLTSC